MEVQGRLTVVKEAGTDDQGRRQVLVRCECGTEKVVLYRSFSHNKTQSCGCLRIEKTKEATTKHGHLANATTTPEYEAWRTMMHRCYNETTESYPWYGGKGIRVCKKWQDSFESFLEDVGFRPSDAHQLCLVDKSKDFKPGNVKWATKFEVGRTRRNNTFYEVNGVSKCLVDWASEYGIPKSTLHYRVVTKGMSMRDALDIGLGRQGKLLPE